MYPYNIPSVADIHPVLAINQNIVNVQAFQGVNMSKAIGTPVDPLAAVEAERTVKALSGTQSKWVYFSMSITNVMVLLRPSAECHHRGG
jgi:hypothetical protein